jgi:hypothetical protein
MHSMKALDQAQMREATRLTRSGRLTDAVSILQRALGGVARQDEPKRSRHAELAPPVIDGEIVAAETHDPTPRGRGNRIRPSFKSKIGRRSCRAAQRVLRDPATSLRRPEPTSAEATRMSPLADPTNCTFLVALTMSPAR